MPGVFFSLIKLWTYVYQSICLDERKLYLQFTLIYCLRIFSFITNFRDYSELSRHLSLKINVNVNQDFFDIFFTNFPIYFYYMTIM